MSVLLAACGPTAPMDETTTSASSTSSEVPMDTGVVPTGASATFTSESPVTITGESPDPTTGSPDSTSGGSPVPTTESPGETTESPGETTDVSTSTGGDARACAGYCATILANCSEPKTSQYSDQAACEAICPAFPLGEPGAVDGNSLGCRTYHAGAAEGDPPTHCNHAGPGGGHVCGEPCEGFCSLAIGLCPAVYADTAACMAECATFPASNNFDTSQTSGDSLGCRLNHLVAAGLDPGTECPNIHAASPVCQ